MSPVNTGKLIAAQMQNGGAYTVANTADAITVQSCQVWDIGANKKVEIVFVAYFDIADNFSQSY